jgi:uncharacterized membrane protein YciS (DUF1049 family)
MSNETWVLVGLGLIANALVVGGGYVNIKTALTAIQTDLKWIKKRCPQCQPTSEENMK